MLWLTFCYVTFGLTIRKAIMESFLRLGSTKAVEYRASINSHWKLLFGIHLASARNFWPSFFQLFFRMFSSVEMDSFAAQALHVPEVYQEPVHVALHGPVVAHIPQQPDDMDDAPGYCGMWSCVKIFILSVIFAVRFWNFVICANCTAISNAQHSWENQFFCSWDLHCDQVLLSCTIPIQARFRVT